MIMAARSLLLEKSNGRIGPYFPRFSREWKVMQRKKMRLR